MYQSDMFVVGKRWSCWGYNTIIPPAEILAPKRVKVKATGGGDAAAVEQDKQGDECFLLSVNYY